LRPCRLLLITACLGLTTSLPARIVTTNTASGPGSLRQTIADAPGGATITFDPSLSGQTIPLTIDASALANGLIIDGQGRNRLFHCGGSTTNTFVALTSTGGFSSQSGGAILNDSRLTLNDCTFIRNLAIEGGAIFLFEPVTLNNCTLAHNVATNEGGAILNFFVTVMNNCTVVSNQSFYAGAISDDDTLYLTNCIIAGNMADLGSTAQIGGTIDGAGGVNLISNNAMVYPLGDYGGRTHTMPPLPGSPAIDPVGGHTTSVFATDQRGSPRAVNGIVDAGAVEVHAASVTPPLITGAEVLNDGMFQLSFSNLSGASFQILASTNIDLPTSNWPTIGPATETPPGSGMFEFTDSDATNLPHRYYRVRSP